MQVSAVWWVGFNLGVLALLGLDLLVLHRDRRPVSFQSALGLSIFWVLLAAVFGAAIGLGGVGGYAATQRGPACLQFFTAYSLEESLSLDNVFVWVLLFRHFRVPTAHQRGVLSCGVVVAMAMRAVLILGGIALARHFGWVFYLFGAYLLWAALRMLRPQRTLVTPGRNYVWHWLKPWVRTTEDNPEGRIFVRQHGRWFATSLFAVLLTLEMSDLTFAFDSVPAVLAVTRDPFIAYTSNILAVLGLRALFFLLQHVIERCWLLPYGIAVLLGFIGLKMLTTQFYEVPLAASLAFIALVLAGCIAGSWLVKPPSPTN